MHAYFRDRTWGGFSEEEWRLEREDNFLVKKVCCFEKTWTSKNSLPLQKSCDNSKIVCRSKKSQPLPKMYAALTFNKLPSGEVLRSPFAYPLARLLGTTLTHRADNPRTRRRMRLWKAGEVNTAPHITSGPGSDWDMEKAKFKKISKLQHFKQS